MITLKPTKGVLLIAEPSIIGDVSFNRSVVLLAEHNDHGSVGFILNKPLEYRLRDFLPDVDSGLRVYNGGPVEQDNLYFIHKIPDLIPNSIEISNGIYWGGDFNTILGMLQADELEDHQIQFFLGYSGWSSDQLEDELELNSWVVSPNEEENSIIGQCQADYWKEKMKSLGGEYMIWSNAPENPNHN